MRNPWLFHANPLALWRKGAPKTGCAQSPSDSRAYRKFKRRRNQALHKSLIRPELNLDKRFGRPILHTRKYRLFFCILAAVLKSKQAGF
jgi:hypothetical protein